VIGANLGANKDTEDKAADYVAGLIRLKGLADYVTVNVSSPNTPGLRALQGRAALDDLLGRLAEARGTDPTPVFLKIAPDLTPAEIGLIVEASLDHRIDALIVSNTTLDRPDSLRSRDRAEAGGLSGAPLKARSGSALRAAAEAGGGRLPLIAAGGAVQLYSALIYEGPGLIGRIKRDLAARLRADGFSTVAEAVSAAR
jgi:dihydroorotate dehydrogenase